MNESSEQESLLKRSASQSTTYRQDFEPLSSKFKIVGDSCDRLPKCRASTKLKAATSVACSIDTAPP